MMNKNKNTIIYIVLLSVGLVIVLGAAFVVILMNKEITVSINTNPSGASFKVNSVEGKTPAKIKLKPGNYKISLSMNDFSPQENSFKVKSSDKNVVLSYSLVNKPPKPSQEAIDTNFGAGKLDPNWQGKLRAVKEKYASFYSELPYKGESFYILRPTWDDKFFIYIPQNDPEGGKRAVAGWFADNGLYDLSKINIIWQYGVIK